MKEEACAHLDNKMRNRSRHTRHVGTLVRERVGMSACGCVSAWTRRGAAGAWRAGVGCVRWHVGVGTLPRECIGVWSCRCVGGGIGVWPRRVINVLARRRIGKRVFGLFALCIGAWCMVHGHVGSRQGFLLFPTG